MLGLTPFVPQLSHFWNESTPLPRELWLRYDMAIIERCQLVLRLPGKSEGAEVEERCAKQLGIPWIVAEHEPLAYYFQDYNFHKSWLQVGPLDKRYAQPMNNDSSLECVTYFDTY